MIRVFPAQIRIKCVRSGSIALGVRVIVFASTTVGSQEVARKSKGTKKKSEDEVKRVTISIKHHPRGTKRKWKKWKKREVMLLFI